MTPLAGLAAGADALAAVGGAAHPAGSAKCSRVRSGAGAAAAPGRAGASVIGGGVDHHARVERGRRGSNRRLDLAHRLVELVAEDARG